MCMNVLGGLGDLSEWGDGLEGGQSVTVSWMSHPMSGCDYSELAM